MSILPSCAEIFGLAFPRCCRGRLTGCARFILRGSSARQLRRNGANLLPGRSFLHRLQPLMLCEQPPKASGEEQTAAVLDMPWPAGKPDKPFPSWKLEDRLAYGSLPGVVTARQADRTDFLRAYAALHLEEEIRRETLIRNWGNFLQFLRSGISQPTVKANPGPLFEQWVRYRALETPPILGRRQDAARG